jgi:hypothetical protein
MMRDMSGFNMFAYALSGLLVMNVILNRALPCPFAFALSGHRYNPAFNKCKVISRNDMKFFPVV